MCAGGALATLAAAWAAFEYPSADVRCITLGSPRTGNAEFVQAVKYLAGNSYRLINGWDPVPTVPPPGFFKHVKGRMWLHQGRCRLIKRPWCATGSPQTVLALEAGDSKQLTFHANALKS